MRPFFQSLFCIIFSLAFCLLNGGSSLAQQSRTVTGFITDGQGHGVPEVTVQISRADGTPGQSASTRSGDGKYTVSFTSRTPGGGSADMITILYLFRNKTVRRIENLDGTRNHAISFVLLDVRL